jgi:hypothetical protein
VSSSGSLLCSCPWNLFVCKSVEFCHGQCNANSNDHSDTTLEAYFKAQDPHTELLSCTVTRESFSALELGSSFPLSF